MKINVTDKTEKLKLGSIYELRGNFKEIVNEEGDTSYECDMYRSTDRNDTFRRLEMIKFMNETRYISNNFADLDEDEKADFLAEVSYTLNFTNQEIIYTRKMYRKELNMITGEINV